MLVMAMIPVSVINLITLEKDYFHTDIPKFRFEIVLDIQLCRIKYFLFNFGVYAFLKETEEECVCARESALVSVFL